jgi:hypothetical protein
MMLQITRHEAALSIAPITGAEIIVRKKARNRGAWGLCLTACHVYPSCSLKFGKRRRDLALDLDAINQEPVELCDPKDSIHRSIGITEGKSPLVGLNELLGQPRPSRPRERSGLMTRDGS